MLETIVERVLKIPNERWKRRALGLLLTLNDGKFLKSSYGPFIRVRSRDFTNWASITGAFKSDYDDVFAEVLKLDAGMAFVDIGANAGLFSLVSATRIGAAGRIVAFEPSISLFKDLIDNAARNGVCNFYPFNIAIGNKTEIARFTPGTENHSGIGHLNPAGSITVLQASFVDLKPLWSTIIGERRSFVKIDVEGAEEVVIDSMREFLSSDLVEKIIVEIDEGFLRRFGSSPNSIYQKLRDFGFSPTRGNGAARHYNEIFNRLPSP